MKKLNVISKLSLFILLVIVAVSSCKKAEDPYAAYTSESETAKLNEWKAKMKAGNLAYDSTATKIYYVIDKTKIGTGPNVTTGNTVTVKYTGTFMDGAIFDSSESFSYVHKPTTGSRMIPGWEEGIELLNKGARATFLFPSVLAYGSSGYYPIPPYSPLFFIIEVVDIK
jgi:FKBP-type peptidyl-prolyl cis-trans isomerase